MLAFHRRGADCLMQSDSCLTVFGRGLGLHGVLVELVRRQLEGWGSDAKHATRLVLLLNTPPEEADLLVRHVQEQALLQGWATGQPPRFMAVGSEMTTEDRAQAFVNGGVFVVSARLVVPDVLVGRIVPEAVDGIIINHAHYVSELSAEAFVLQLFRRFNKRGFVRAISDRPDGFSGGQAQVEKVMQRCFVQQLEVWPRIRLEVQESLQQGCQPDVCQKMLELPPLALKIQRHMLNIIEGMLTELRQDPTLDIQHLGVHESLFHSFDAELRRALDPMWHSLGPRTRRMVHDLSSIRQLLFALLQCDAVEFLGLLENVWAAETSTGEVPPWLASPDAQALQVLARERVYQLAPARPGQHACITRILEPHAKWRVLLEILESTVGEVCEAAARSMTISGNGAKLVNDESPLHEMQPVAQAIDCCEEDSGSDIEIVSVSCAKKPRLVARPLQQSHANSCGENNGPLHLETGGALPSAPVAPSVLEPRLMVIVPDEKVKRQVCSVLHRGSDATLLDALRAHLRDGSKSNSKVKQQIEASGVWTRSAEAQLLTREAHKVDRDLEQLPPHSVLQMRQLHDGRACHPCVEVVALDGPEGTLAARLQDAHPHAVVLWEPCLRSIRALEVFCAGLSEFQLRSSGPIVIKRELGTLADDSIGVPNGSPSATRQRRASPKAYLLVFEESIEKYRFQQALMQESTAVDALIRARQHLTVRVDDRLLAAEKAAEQASRSSRRGGGAKLDKVLLQRVVVDMREFRSALPFMLYQRNLTIEPVTIPVGDYILSRDICVERKSIPDLVQSLGSGRLYQQSQNMCQHYMNPSLLIEFDPAKSFALQNAYALARREVHVGSRDLLGKLALIVLHFTKLRLIWSPSQRFTADLFLKLKEGRYQPDSKAAAEVDADNFGERAEDNGTSAGRAIQRNSVAFDVLRKLPGVTPKNLYALARRGGSLAGIAAMRDEELAEILGKTGAQQLHSFLTQDVSLHTSPAQTGALLQPRHQL